MTKNIFITIIFILFINQSYAEENIMILKLKDGDVVIELYSDIAPNHVKRFKQLADNKDYDGVVFHRVILHMKEELYLPPDLLILIVLIVNFLYVLSQLLTWIDNTQFLVK